MANEVTITVIGRDRTGGLFSGLPRRANTAFGEVRQVIQKQVAGATADAEAGGRSIGDRLIGGAADAVASKAGELASEIGSSMSAAGESAGAGFGDGVVSGAETRLRDAKGRFVSAIVSSDEAEQEGRGVGSKLVSGLMASISAGATQVRTAFTSAYRAAEGDAEGSGRNIGTRLAAGLRAGVSVGTDAVRGLLTGHWGSLGGDADRDGRGIGSKLISGISGAVSSGASALGGGLKTVLSEAGSAAGPALFAAVAGAAVPAALAAGTAMGGALVLGFGAQLVGLGVQMLMHTEEINKEWSKAEQKRVEESNKQAEKLRKQFTELNRDIVNGFKEAAQPLVGVLDTFRAKVREVGAEFKPVFAEAFETAKVPLQQFIRDFGDGIKELKPALVPLTEAFSGLLSKIGPQLKPLFSSIADSLTGLSKAVNENQTLISGMFTGLLNLIPTVINGISLMITTFGQVGSVVYGIQTAIETTFLGATQAVLGFAEKVLGVFRDMAQAMTNLPGMEEMGRKLVSGLDAAIAKVGEWKQSAADASKAVELKANIIDLTQKIDAARAQLQDPELTKERRAELNAEISKLVAAKGQALVQLGDPKLVAEYKSSITTEIATLQARLATAKKELQNPELTKERKSKLNAEISQLQAQVKAAKAALASIPNKTVTVTVRTVGDTSVYKAGNVTASTRARGGIIGAAGGGPRSNMTLVGEQGPELVRLPFGSTVIPNGQSERMLKQGGGGGTVVNLYVQGSIRSDRDLIQIIRDEFTRGGFRGAVATS